MLSQVDRKEITSILQEGVDKIETRTDNKFEIIHLKLEQILEQTTRHNNRMTKAERRLEDLEKNELVHVANCPIAGQVRTLEDTALTQKGVKRWVVGSVAVTGTVMAILWTMFQILSKIVG